MESTQGLQEERKLSEIEERDRIDRDGNQPGLSDQIKIPVFLGTSDEVVIREIDKLFKASEFIKQGEVRQGKEKEEFNPEKYELLIIGSDIQQKLCEQYVFNLMDKEEQQRQSELLQKEEYKQRANDEALVINELLKYHRPDKEDWNVFKVSELKAIFNKSGKKLNKHQVITLVDFLSLNGYIKLFEHSAKVEDTRFQLVLSSEEEIKYLERERAILNKAIEAYTNQLENINKELEKM